MSVCQIEERDAGRAYPRTCPTCGLGKSCAKGLDRKSQAARIAELEAENARLRKDLHSYEMTMKAIEEADRIERAEALSRTGAVKVKALTFTDPGLGIVYADTIVGTYQINAGGDWWINCDPIKGNGGKTSVIADYERRILSALEPAAPEGEQEAVAYVNASTLRHHIESASSQTSAVLHRERGTLYGEKDVALYTRSTEQGY